MIERLKETGGAAFGFKVVGKLLDEELKTFEPQLEFFISGAQKAPDRHPSGPDRNARSRMDGALG